MCGQYGSVGDTNLTVGVGLIVCAAVLARAGDGMKGSCTWGESCGT